MNKIYDVIVAGAGPGGITAAISAARNGSSVLLLDRNGYPGGTNTSAMVGPLMTFHSGKDQIIKGIAEEIIDQLRKRDATLGHVPDPLGVVSTITPIEPDVLKLVYFSMLSKERRITTLFNTYITGVESNAGKLSAVQTIGKGGSASYHGRCFIDATGDGDLAYYAHADFVMGRMKDGLSQPMTLMFKMRNVNTEEIISYIHKNPEQFIFNRECDLNSYLAVSGFFKEVERAKCNGDLTLPRDRVLCFEGVHKGDMIVNMTRATMLSGVNSQDLTSAEFELYHQIDEILKFLKKYIPGFGEAFLDKVADSVGVRESRRISGMATLDSDVIINSSSSPESVAMCAFPIDIHDPAGADLNWVRKERNCCYDVPFGVMVPKGFSNLLVTGRCISATHEALASVRVTPTVMALGEAAGTAASMTNDFSQININELQEKLASQGAVPGRKWL